MGNDPAFSERLRIAEELSAWLAQHGADDQIVRIARSLMALGFLWTWPPPEVTQALLHLRNLIGPDPGVEAYGSGDVTCHFCGGLQLGDEIRHESDCPYVAAKAFVEALGVPAIEGH